MYFLGTNDIFFSLHTKDVDSKIFNINYVYNCTRVRDRSLYVAGLCTESNNCVLDIIRHVGDWRYRLIF